MTFRQQQPIVTRMFDQPSSGLHQPLLQAGQRPVLDSLGQRQPPPQISQVVSQHTQREPHSVGAETMAREASHLYRLFPLFDPLLSRASLLIEAHHRSAVRPQIGHDEAYSREQLPSRSE